MARTAAGSTNGKANGGANLGFEATLWLAADKLRNNLDAAEYKHVVLGLIDLVGTIGLGDREDRSKDNPGRVYEFFPPQSYGATVAGPPSRGA